MVRDFVSSDIPVSDQCEISIGDLSVVGHFRGASVRVLSLSEKVVDSIDSVRLYGIVTVSWVATERMRHIWLQGPISEGKCG